MGFSSPVTAHCEATAIEPELFLSGISAKE
jgi:hypothetical protein